ncbi:hypothetical protein XENTR_v10005772 [Xenopus tropicalis]|nr:hypothetical protein XENTR_v10005772 [Xenopus tropicalis]
MEHAFFSLFKKHLSERLHHCLKIDIQKKLEGHHLICTIGLLHIPPCKPCPAPAVIEQKLPAKFPEGSLSGTDGGPPSDMCCWTKKTRFSL